MSEIEFKSLNLDTNNETKTVNITKDVSIEVKKYLPIEDKIDFIQIALQEAETEAGYDMVLVDVYFHLYLVYFYTNLQFTDEEKANPLKLFDILESNGIISAVAQAIPNAEFDDMHDYLLDQINNNIHYKTSTVYLLNILMEKFKDATKYLNEADYENILNNIKTNFTENN